MGGIYNVINMHLYHYAGNNPVKYTDPDGKIFVYDENASPQFKADIETIVQYLEKSGLAYEYNQIANIRPEKIILREGAFMFDPETNELFIDTRSGLSLGDGMIQSPALGFYHELQHVMGFLEEPEAYKERAGMFIETTEFYGNAEERHVIINFEIHAARILGEPVRENHIGVSIKVKNPTYFENKGRRN
jgi:hypothetical protein